MMKKLLTWFAISIFSFGLVGVSSAQYIKGSNSIIDTADDGGTVGVELIGTGTGQGDSLANVIRGFINWSLGILALIALIILLRGGFQMVTAAGNEDRYNSGFTILKQAAVGLAMIGIAWFIVSMIFFVINLAGRGGENTPGSTT